MANKSGNAYGLTVLCPILQGGPLNAAGDMEGPTYASIMRYQLQKLGCNSDSPMAKVPNTYLCRFYVLNDVQFQGKPAHLDHLKSDYLVFSSNFHGELEPYLEGLWSAVGSLVSVFLKNCVGFDSVHDSASFVAYIRKCQVTTTFFFVGSTDESLEEQLKGLYLKQEFSKFVFENQGKSAAELQVAFRRFTARTQPGNPSAPTWSAGAVSLETAVTGESAQ
jgi:hypothetical protein